MGLGKLPHSLSIRRGNVSQPRHHQDVNQCGHDNWLAQRGGAAKQATNASKASEVNQAGSESKAIEKAKRSKHEGKH